MRKLLVITGPTATGKTQLGIDLARKFGGEIISADSQQVYKGRDVETGKDKELYKKSGVKVWGLDLLEEGNDFNVAAFVQFANLKIADISRRGKLPIVVGGTGHYLRALFEPFATMTIPPDPTLRSKKMTLKELQESLKKADLKKWRQMNSSDQQNPRRLLRALEVAGKSNTTTQKSPLYDSLIIGLEARREFLYQKISQRRASRPDLVKKEWQLAKKQLLYQKKYLPAVWFDITRLRAHNKIWQKVAVFIPPRINKRKDTLTT